nr:hypothetical protein [Streptomyces sp. S1D4-11]QIY99645.1 hypothetical protein HEP87_44350 [Streptomyces sp. S1D4-11]
MSHASLARKHLEGAHAAVHEAAQRSMTGLPRSADEVGARMREFAG